MRTFKYLFFISFCIFSFAACNNKDNYQSPPSVEQLFNDYKKSVVLIYNRYYYELKVDEQTSIYFTSLDGFDESNIYTDKEDAIKNAANNMGTGFFISDDGKIATNLHVLQPEITERHIAAFDYMMESFLSEYESNINEVATNIQEVENALQNTTALTAVEIAQLKNQSTNLNNSYKALSKFKNLINYDVNKLQFKTAYVGIAYENAKIEPVSEESADAMFAFRKNFAECDVIKLSNDRKLDLAIIQLKNKTTPDFITKIFNFEDNNPNINLATDTIQKFDIYNPAGINKDVYMIGYNYGLELAKTAAGIKPQFTKGIVSQESDGIKVMYTIPALPGSSGSPVIDGWGNLVAINFAGILNTQSFNYGILSKHLLDLNNGKKSNEKMIKEDENFFKKSSEKSTEVAAAEAVTEVENIANDPDATTHLYIISQFLSYEDKRDIQSILNSLSETMEGYWDLKDISKAAIRSRYENNWKQSKWSKNHIESVTYIQPRTYKAIVIFKYENNKGEQKEVKSTLKFIFDNQNKINYINKF